MSEFFQIDDDAPARRVLYASALLLIAVPFILSISQIWPLLPANIQWRFAAANALSSILLLPFLGLVLLLVIGRMTASRQLSVAVGAISAGFTIGLLGCMVLFVLDGLQLKAVISSAQLAAFQSIFSRVTMVTALFIPAFAMLALAGLRAPRGSMTTTRRGTTSQPDDGVGLIVGRA